MLLRHPSAREWWIIELKVPSTVDSSRLFHGVWYPALKRRGGSLTVGCNEEDALWERAVWCAAAAVPDLANLRWEGGQGCSGVGDGARRRRAEVSAVLARSSPGTELIEWFTHSRGIGLEQLPQYPNMAWVVQQWLSYTGETRNVVMAPHIRQ